MRAFLRKFIPKNESKEFSSPEEEVKQLWNVYNEQLIDMSPGQVNNIY